MATFFRLLRAWQAGNSPEEKVAAVGAIIGPQTDALLEDCQAYTAVSEHNYLPFLWPYFKPQRSVLHTILAEVQIIAPGSDKSLEQALRFVAGHRAGRQEWVGAESEGTALALNWVPEK